MGIVGLGAFGRFMVKHLAPYFSLSGYDRQEPSPELLRRDQAEALRLAGFDEVCRADVAVFAVPMESLEEVARRAAPFLRPGALVVDVTSVKLGPVELLNRLLPPHVRYFATHPMFGPQSGRDGIAGMRVAVHPARMERERYYAACDFLAIDLKLSVLRVAPDEHDREMARVQAATHFISRALKAVGFAPSPLATKAYDRLLEFGSIVLSDSWDLFATIQNGNPYAADLRRQLLEELHRLDDQLAGIPDRRKP